MAYKDFITQLHRTTKRDYLERVIRGDKAECAQVARRFGRDYWDGDRRYGYGGYSYDGRWAPVAREMIDYYGLKAGSRVLDIGCGKAFLIYEMFKAVPGLSVAGVDISDYAIENSMPEVRPFVRVGSATELPFENGSFDLVLSLNVLHNLPLPDVVRAISEMERVGKGRGYIVVESWRNEQEKDNLLNWQLTCESFYTPATWKWLFQTHGYRGDYSFIYFE